MPENNNNEQTSELENIIEKFGEEAPSYGRKGIDGPSEPTRRYDANAAVGEKKWLILSDGIFKACGETTDLLPSTIFRCNFDDYGNVIYNAVTLQNDELLHLPDSKTESVLQSIENFWNSKEKFVSRGFLFKRGILLCGAPGGGKTTCVLLLVEKLIARKGIVILGENPHVVGRALQTLRKIEPERPLIVILEDLDELVLQYSEAAWLSLLDGENQINNVVFIGTTNYPERLDRRFINRPSRFDEIVPIPMPNAAARRFYLEQKAKPGDFVGLDEHTTRLGSQTELIEHWVTATEGFSIAHLRELYVSVFCLGNSFDSVMSRLKTMNKGKGQQFGRAEMGFGPGSSGLASKG